MELVQGNCGVWRATPKAFTFCERLQSTDQKVTLFLNLVDGWVVKTTVNPVYTEVGEHQEPDDAERGVHVAIFVDVGV